MYMVISGLHGVNAPSMASSGRSNDCKSSVNAWYEYIKLFLVKLFVFCDVFTANVHIAMNIKKNLISIGTSQNIFISFS